MEQFTMPKEAIVSYDYEAQGVAEPVKEFRPLIFKDGDSFCVVLGPDPQAGVFGCGCSVNEALGDWVTHFNEVVTHPADDEVSRYILDTLKTDKKDVW